MGNNQSVTTQGVVSNQQCLEADHILGLKDLEGAHSATHGVGARSFQHRQRILANGVDGIQHPWRRIRMDVLGHVVGLGLARIPEGDQPAMERVEVIAMHEEI